MKSPQYKQEEPPASIAQRLLHRKKLTQETYRALEDNKTAQDRRLNEFGKEEENKKK